MTERIDVTLAGLRQLLDRVGRGQVEAGDWPLIAALVSKLIARAEDRQERMAAKVAAAAERAAATEGASEAQAIDAEDSVHQGSGSATGCTTPSAANATGRELEPTGGCAAENGDPEKAKGHGRNGASAYTKAKHFFYVLAGVIGTVCMACGLGRMNRYREKVIIRIVGQPLFTAEEHHYEQVRCRKCGHIVRATGPACVHEGIGTDYVRYDWSACAMLMVMHYFSGAPFKRLESLHAGWGIPMADANQWALVNAGEIGRAHV